jgi:hypothetical protein
MASKGATIKNNVLAFSSCPYYPYYPYGYPLYPWWEN